MAKSVSMMAKSLLAGGRYGLWLAVSVLSSVVCAQSLPDPTRPPAVIADKNALAAGARAGAFRREAAGAAGGLVLQSVLISPGRRVAVVNGQTVQVGDRLGDKRVSRIAEGEIVLANGKETQVLKLFPGIEKRQIRAEQQPK